MKDLIIENYHGYVMLMWENLEDQFKFKLFL